LKKMPHKGHEKWRERKIRARKVKGQPRGEETRTLKRKGKLQLGRAPGGGVIGLSIFAKWQRKGMGKKKTPLRKKGVLTGSST